VDPYFSDLLADLRRSGLNDLAGSRLSAHIPVSRALLNQVVAHVVQKSAAPVRDLDIRPLDGDRFDAVITTKWRLVPPLKIAFAIERQPAFPDSPALVLRWSLLGVLGAIASRVIAAFDRLPAGVRFQDDRLVLDIPALAAGGPATELLPYVTALRLHTVAGRAMIDLELEISERRSPEPAAHAE
jgi:hypothetical protein